MCLREVRAGTSFSTRQRCPALPPEPRAGIQHETPSTSLDGRQTVVELRRQLQRSWRLTLHGLGGVGKTQLALRYLDEHHNDYPDGRFWLRADRATSLVGDLASLVWRMELRGASCPNRRYWFRHARLAPRRYSRWPHPAARRTRTGIPLGRGAPRTSTDGAQGSSVTSGGSVRGLVVAAATPLEADVPWVTSRSLIYSISNAGEGGPGVRRAGA